MFLWCNNGNSGGVSATGGVGTASPSSKYSVSTSDVMSDVSSVESTDVKTIVESDEVFPLSGFEVGMMGWVFGDISVTIVT